jgi:hypothetical protein
MRVSAASSSFEMQFAAASSTTWVNRVYVYFVTFPTGAALGRTMFLYSGTAGAALKESDSKIYAADTSGTGASGVAVTTGVWYCIDVKMTATTIDVQVNGVACGQRSGSYSAVTTWRVGADSDATGIDFIFDDFVASQTVGDYPIGSGYILSYIPNADGTHNIAGGNDFERSGTGVDITNATTDAWTLCSERPLPTSEVDFINGVAPPNPTDYVEVVYESSAEVSAPRAVEAVASVSDPGGAGTNNWTVTLRHQTGGTTGNIFSEAMNIGTTPTTRTKQFSTIPGTANAWTLAALNDLRSRMLVTDASPDPHLNALMLEVEFPELVVDRVQKFSPYPQLLAH